MTRLCGALFKDENKIKLAEKINANICGSLKGYPV